jgi:hypothetical protein
VLDGLVVITVVGIMAMMIMIGQSGLNVLDGRDDG